MRTITIPLTNSSLPMIIDECDHEEITKNKCWLNSRGYALTIKNKRKILVHRFLMGAIDPLIKVDHKNRNPLDNRRANLRLCTQAQNLVNRPLQYNNKTGYRGVSIYKDKYRCTLMIHKKQIYLGLFECPIIAAKTYDKVASECFGEFAVLNFPKGEIA